jgi:outer membrane protein
LQRIQTVGYTLTLAPVGFSSPWKRAGFCVEFVRGMDFSQFRLAHGGRLAAAEIKENTVNSRIFQPAALVAACLFLGASSWAQTPAAGSATNYKIGVVNTRQAIASTEEGKQASAELQAQFAPRQTELKNLSKQIDDLRQRLDAGSATLSDEEKARLTREGQRLTTQLNRKQQDYQDDVNAALGDVQDRIGRKLMDVLDRYARENGFQAIFDTSAQDSQIIYASNQIDVTQDIVKLYDQAYPVKASTSAPVKPATPKPKP